MIELPRACVRADEIAGEADFFSFGTNDLTQTRARVLAGRRRGQVPDALPRRPHPGGEPFKTLDVERRRPHADRGRARARPEAEIKLGICGEHGGDPRSVAFCHDLGLDYVSCSPYQVPLARLAAAQAALAEAGVEVVAVGG